MNDDNLIAFFAMMASPSDIEQYQSIKLSIVDVEVPAHPNCYTNLIRRTPTFTEAEARLRFAANFLKEYKNFIIKCKH